LQKAIPPWAEKYINEPMGKFIVAGLNANAEERREAFPPGRIREHPAFAEACAAPEKRRRHCNDTTAPYRPVLQRMTDRLVLGFCDWNDDLILRPEGVKLRKPAVCTQRQQAVPMN